MSYNKLRLPIIVIVLALFPLVKFELISKTAGGMVMYVCLILSFIFLILESIQDKEISISGSSIDKATYPKTYWMALIGFIILSTAMTAVLVIVLLKGPIHQ
jgi:hypothetical protein